MTFKLKLQKQIEVSYLGVKDWGESGSSMYQGPVTKGTLYVQVGREGSERLEFGELHRK